MGFLGCLPIHPEYTAHRRNGEEQNGKADQQRKPVFLQAAELMLQSTKQVCFVDLQRLGGNLDAVTHRGITPRTNPFPRPILAPYTKEVTGLSMQ
jgi:hypothetical protein